jgi:hypothetical protein
MQTRKFFLIGMTVLLSASLVLIGCPTDTEEKTVTVTQTEMVHLDVFAANITKLVEYLAAPGDLSIGLSAGVTLSDDLTIPAGKLVYILNAGSLATSGSYTLTVEGQVYVGVRGTLTATAAAPVEVTTGTVYVVKRGTLDIDTALAVTDGATPTPAPALGNPAKVVLAAESTLELSAALADAAALTAALGYVGTGGTLEATVTGSKPSSFQGLDLKGKKLITTALADEDSQNALIVPAGLELTAKTSDTLATITGLTVNGSFSTEAGTLSKVTALTVGEDGELDVSGAGTLAALTTLTVNGDLTVKDTINGIVPTGTGTITFGSAVSWTPASLLTFNATPAITFADTVAVSTSGIVFNGPVAFGGNVTLTAVPATFGGTAYFANSTVLTLTTDASVVTLKANTGALAAGEPSAKPWVYDAVLQADGGDAILKPDSSSVTLTFATGTRGITQSAAGLTVSGKAHITSGATYTVPSGSGNKLTVAADSVLTLGSGALEGQGADYDTATASIVLTGAGSNAGTLVLAAKNSTPAAAGGGGKLVLVGGGDELGTDGVIQVKEDGTSANLTATGPADGTAAPWAFTGNSGTTGITGLENSTPKGFTSIEAATSSGGSTGLVTFKAGASSTAKLNKTSTAQGTE